MQCTMSWKWTYPMSIEWKKNESLLFPNDVFIFSHFHHIFDGFLILRINLTCSEFTASSFTNIRQSWYKSIESMLIITAGQTSKGARPKGKIPPPTRRIQRCWSLSVSLMESFWILPVRLFFGYLLRLR